MEEVTVYKPIAEKKAKLRLYINDRAISQHIIESLNCPIPIEIEGTMVIARKGKKMHIFFTHKEPEPFIPVFIDYEGDLE